MCRKRKTKWAITTWTHYHSVSLTVNAKPPVTSDFLSNLSNIWRSFEKGSEIREIVWSSGDSFTFLFLRGKIHNARMSLKSSYSSLHLAALWSPKAGLSPGHGLLVTLAATHRHFNERNAVGWCPIWWETESALLSFNPCRKQRVHVTEAPTNQPAAALRKLRI